MPLLISLFALLFAGIALARSNRSHIRSCLNCHAPLGAGQIDCPVCTRR